MERFTEWKDGRGAGKPGKDCHTQLAKYEDTGLTPEQIFEIDRLYSEKCKELAEKEKRLNTLNELHTEVEEISYITGVSSKTYVEKDKMLYLDVLRERKDETLSELWKELGDVTIDPKTECITQDWYDFKAGTPREDIWHWFDEMHSKGVVYLMYGRETDE